MAPKDHDQAVAAISHLPHVVASALAGVTSSSLLHLVAGGWRDTTRVASGDPGLWRHILSQNRFHLLQVLDAFGDELSQFRRALTYNDVEQMEQLLQKGKDVRDLQAT
jgi:prephenate dehydrogenase